MNNYEEPSYIALVFLGGLAGACLCILLAGWKAVDIICWAISLLKN